MEHELWFTALLNKLLAGLLTPLLTTIGVPPQDPSQPIPNYIAMEVLVIVVILTGALLLRGRLSVENPGKFQHLMEFSRVLDREPPAQRSEEHTSELQSPCNLVCRLLLEKKKKKKN